MTLKIFYAAGPGDIIAAHKHWRQGADDPTQMSLTYSGQFADACRDLDATAYMISYNERRDVLRDGQFTLEHRPKRVLGGGALFHLSEIMYGLSLLVTAVRFKADVAVISSGTTHYFVLALFRLFGIRVVTVLHNTLWPKGHPPTRLGQRIVMKLDGLFFRSADNGVIGISPECTRQVSELAKGRTSALHVMYPQFRRQNFAGIPPAPSPADRPFKIIFAGRVERNKGVFDILEMARRIEDAHPGLIRWDICGNGTDLEGLKQSHQELRLADVVTIHGWTAPTDLRRLQGDSHLSIVPTRSDFAEGIAKTALEAVLAGRPVLISSVIPALEIIGAAAIAVEANDVDKFVETVIELANDQQRYRRLVLACGSVQEILYDGRNGFLSTLKRVIADDVSLKPAGEY
ncbi:glycosyltransferase family 4 protein [Bradyrhizobium sp. CCGUVB14]|uniref:glycosyltransferase family 4 protein n=1 Tax=Bradyrhizobium sp. CCGUVB14 TaxID=2949628 RepID=UPI0020B294BC|nr:glycosyltransferase family 4 protein [Bradyrhizobium sp. CCGUVB14]MCP3442045.1 glycosyltransferase family 4 protein [Bradyrhizobium sp. CCGUVB14]